MKSSAATRHTLASRGVSRRAFFGVAFARVLRRPDRARLDAPAASGPPTADHGDRSFDVRRDPVAGAKRWPRTLLACLEIIYMGCFLLVPAGFAALAATGRAVLADRYWTLVAGAEFGAFVPLSFVQTRPPWALERKAAPPRGVDAAVHRLASRAVRDFTINANTFPSGHVAGSLAVAFALLGPMPWVGAIFLFFAGSMSVACVVGRYHYVVDTLAGAALALLIWGMVNAVGP